MHSTDRIAMHYFPRTYLTKGPNIAEYNHIMTNQNDGLKYYTQDAINQIYPLTVLQVKIAQNPGHSTPWLVIAV